VLQQCKRKLRRATTLAARDDDGVAKWPAEDVFFSCNRKIATLQ
jgi:hypothetical protein